MSDRTVQALVTALVWLVVVLVVRWLARKAFERWERRLATRDAAGAARLRTTFSVLQRIIVAGVAVIGVWSVLSIFPQTSDVARALLASSAVLAVFAGLALNTPLGNLGSGLLVAFTQPLRLGDRVTVGDQTGFVEQINLIYTQLVTDDDRRIFVPNTQLTTSAIVNRTIKDPRRAVVASVPVRLGAPLGDACAVALAAAKQVESTFDQRVTVRDVTDRLAWLEVTAYAPLDADVAMLASQVRQRCVEGLAAAEALPS